MHPYGLILAPSPLGLWPSGVQELGRTLLDHGLAERLNARFAGTVQPEVYVREKDAVTGYLNGPKIAKMAVEVAGLVAAEIAQGRVPLILGGDCSVIFGGLLALRRRSGALGLFYLDGHADFYDGTGMHSGEVADMGLAIATGRNHPSLSDVEGLCPYVQPGHAIAYGFRDEEHAALDGSPSPRGTGIALYDLPRLRAEGTAACLAGAMDLFRTEAIGRVWLHFDTDVIDDALNPAVDYPLAGGLTWAEAAEAIAALRTSKFLAGASVSIFNPRKDADGRVAMALTQCLVDGLRDRREQ